MTDPLSVNVRPWRREDLAAGLDLFDSNVPRFFAPSERQDFIGFVEATDDPYFVLEDAAGNVVGCGGFGRAEHDPSAVVLCWGMVRSDLHGRGLGDLLLRMRLDRIASDPTHRIVEIETTQHSQGFFARYGFAEKRSVADGFAPGMDLVEMTLELDLYRSRAGAGSGER